MKKKYNYIKTPSGRSRDLKLKEMTDLQEELKKLGLYVSFHPTALHIHTRIEKEDYNYLKENRVF